MNDKLAPPRADDAELAVLGTVLLTETVLSIALEDGLRPEHFYFRRNEKIFKTMMQLQSENSAVDPLTVLDRLRSDGILEAIGGRAYVDLLSGAVPAIGNFRSYCKIVTEKYRWRCRRTAAYKQLEAIDVEDEEAHSKAMAEADIADALVMSSTVDPAMDFMRWYDSDTKGIVTPFETLTDALGGGFLPGDVTIVGGWPGHGKTILADMCILAAKKNNPDLRCHIYFNELAAPIRTARMVSRITGVPWWDIRDKNLNSAEIQVVIDGLKSIPAKYERIEGWTLDEVVRHVRRLRWDFAVIDTATRIPAKDTKEIEEVSGRLADVARETGCHILLVVQLNLERVKQIIKPSPTARDLLGGGAWWRDARNVLFVHRRQEKIPGLDMARALLDGHVLCDKATHGEPEKGLVPVSFSPRWMRFDLRDTPILVPSDLAPQNGADLLAPDPMPF